MDLDGVGGDVKELVGHCLDDSQLFFHLFSFSLVDCDEIAGIRILDFHLEVSDGSSSPIHTEDRLPKKKKRVANLRDGARMPRLQNEHFPWNDPSPKLDGDPFMASVSL